MRINNQTHFNYCVDINMRLRAAHGAHTLNAIMRKGFKSCQERKSFRLTLFQKGHQGQGAEALCRRPQTAKSPYGRRSAKGELKNSPVDCFSRGKSLQERDFPCCSATLSFRVPLWNAKRSEKFLYNRLNKFPSHQPPQRKRWLAEYSSSSTKGLAFMI